MKIFGTRRNADHIEKKGGKAKKVIISLLIVAIVLGGGAYAFMTWFVRPPTPHVFVPPRETPSVNLGEHPAVPPEQDPEAVESEILTLLVAGQDDVGEFGLSDTIMLVLIDVADGRVNVLNIPRDLKVDAPWEMPKINSVYTVTGSVDGLMAAAEAITGYLPRNYVILDMQAFSDLVDVINGVTFNVPYYMWYDDPYQNLVIHLQPGYQHLTGDQAIQLVRWRQNNDGSGLPDGDLGRIRIQQDFMRALAGELLQIQNVTRIGEVARIFMEHVETDLYIGNLIWYAQQLMSIDSEDITFLTMPNYEANLYGISYQVIELEEWLTMLNTYFNPTPFTIGEENLRVVAWKDGFVQHVGQGLTFTPRA